MLSDLLLSVDAGMPSVSLAENANVLAERAVAIRWISWGEREFFETELPEPGRKGGRC